MGLMDFIFDTRGAKRALTRIALGSIVIACILGGAVWFVLAHVRVV